MMPTGIQNAFRGKAVLGPSNPSYHNLSASRDNEILDKEEQYVSFKNESSKKMLVMRTGPLCALLREEADYQMLLYNYYFISAKAFHFS